MPNTTPLNASISPESSSTESPAGSPPAKNAVLSEKSAKQRYDELMRDADEPSAVERLRFFCSLAMRGQDWLDVEPFFNDVLAELDPCCPNT
jgi:hypothetical protein